ncbi:MAG: putative glycosyltransferase EpsH [Eubacteriales bacterium SKADARSKE-1]|nr:putative glycosyltransferase EpsH [Eubacteriales bacterium SKADARSKE-1]
MVSKIPTISLIVPVYNSEEYLKFALESVVNQTFKDFEVIIVNDGSTDSSPEIIKEFCSKYDNFHFINQENQGQGLARNAGMKIAKGEYIAFLDSDDYLAPSFFEDLYKMITESNADISYCNYYVYFPNVGLKLWMPFTAKTGLYSSKKALGKLICDISLHHFPWNKLYKRTLFTENNIEFYNMYFEDVATCPKMFFYAKTVAVTTKPLYYYRRHNTSTIALMDVEKINDFIKSLGIIRNFLEEQNIYQQYKWRFNLYAIRAKIQTYFCILHEHMVHSDFSGILKNFKNASISINLFMSDRYKKVDDPLVLPFYVKTPKENRERKKFKI